MTALATPGAADGAVGLVGRLAPRHVLLIPPAVALVVVLAVRDYREVVLSGSGIAQGALVAAIALGIVVTYRGSGVVNLANGAIAMYAAYVYTLLRAEGDLFLPPLPNPLALVEGFAHATGIAPGLDLPDLPTRIDLGPTMQFWPAVALSLLFCVVLGLALHLLVFLPLRHAPVLAKVVASVGVFLFLQAVVIVRFTTTPRSVRPLPFADKSQVDLGIISIAQDQLVVAGVVIVCAVGLWFLFQRTRFGLATRAAAENERGAVVLGYSPDLLAGVNWVLSTVLTGALGILVASVNANVDPIVIPALVVPALSAALVGGFTSFGWTTVAAFLLGMQVPLVQYLGVAESWFPKADGLAVPGVDTLLPFLVILAVLIARGDAIPQRGATAVGRLPRAPVSPAWALRWAGPVLTLATVAAAMFWFGPTMRGALTNTAIGVVVCLSLVVITGLVGQISLAPMAFAGIAAFAVAELSTDRGWPFPLPLLAGAVAATVVGVLVALPALRIRGVQLAIVTLAFGVTMDRFVFANPAVNGGLDGAPVQRPDLVDQTTTRTWELGPLTVGDGLQPNPWVAVICVLVAAVLAYAVANLRRSTTGRAMLAVRANERAAAAAGVDVARTKVLAFGTSAFVAGIAGGVIAYRQGGAFPSGFGYEQSLMLFAFAYLGGISRVSGAVVGGLLVSGGLAFAVGEEVFGVPGGLGLLIGGLGLILTAVLAPEGIAGTVADRIQGRRGRTRARSNRADDGHGPEASGGATPTADPHHHGGHHATGDAGGATSGSTARAAGATP